MLGSRLERRRVLRASELPQLLEHRCCIGDYLLRVFWGVVHAGRGSAARTSRAHTRDLIETKSSGTWLLTYRQWHSSLLSMLDLTTLANGPCAPKML